MKNKSKSRSTLKGVNRTLYEWAMGYRYINLFLQKCQEGNEILVDLFSDNNEKREKASINFCHYVWGYFPELGPCPIVEVLAEFEHERVFYKNYRDHTTHIIKTFILGLYFYDQVDFVRNAVNNILPTNADKETDFVKLWTITALYHDIGYIFENVEIEKNEEEWILFRNEINKRLNTPLSYTINTPAAKERSFIKTNRIYIDSIESISEIEMKNERTWSILLLGGKESSLSNDELVNGIQKYYEFAAKKKTLNERQGFMDHGICSALLFGKVWYEYFNYIKILADSECDTKSLIEDKNIISLNKKMEKMEELIGIAINAIALHNIDKEIWNNKDAISYQICLNDFHLSFTTLPIACLLKLCDEIQSWDRPRYRRTLETDEIITGGEFDLVSSGGLIYLKFKYDDNFTDPKNFKHSAYSKLHKKLAIYIDSEELDKFLTCGLPAREDNLKKKNDNMTVCEETMDGMNIEIIQKEEIPDTKTGEYADEQWLVGAVNLDEDVHFSSFYLEQSMSKKLPDELKDFGYHNIVAVYEDFNEIYYIPKKECVEVSNRLISYSLKNVDFWADLFQKTDESIDKLEKIFEGLPKRDSFRDLSDSELLLYYEKHYIVHKNLYVYARIPEVLDRGVPTFTNFLKNYLKGCSSELKNEESLNKVFDALTYPEILGYSGENILEMYNVISLINETSSDKEKEEWRSCNGRFLIRMNPEVIQRIEEYTAKWMFWGYHGYRDRALKDFVYFAEKVRIEYANKELKEQKKMLIKRQDEAAENRIRMFKKYKIEEKYQNLFRIYSKIGTIKIKRRYYQLKNFYYLDQLLLEIAKRNEISESTIRCMLPDEIVSFLRGDRGILNEGKNREKAKLFVYSLSDGRDKIICGPEAETEAKRLKELTSHKEFENGELIGDVASIGKYRGICRVMDGKHEDKFERGEILVASDIDPDKFELIKLAGAVITETGGFTCHAAIVCRELQIPCIVGVHDITSYIHTGQRLDVDATRGKIKIIVPITSELISLSSFDTMNISLNEVGTKAYSLFQLSKEGFSVPNFFCVRINALKEIMLKEPTYNEQNVNALIVDIQNTLSEMNNEWWAVRSSTNREDGEVFSGAGQEITMLRVHTTDVVRELYRIAKALEDYNDGGSIIIQKMILGSYSGVVFTDNPIGDSNELVIQAVPGGNEYLTSGKVNPASYYYRKDLFRFDETKEGTWKDLISEKIKDKVKEQAMRIADFFGGPQDIEWTVQENEIYILQSRKITKGCRNEQINIFSAKKSLVVDTISLYQAYALPVHLRNHLLKTAAVVCWIMDHWKGNKLNEEMMIKTCLLHDMGNIVKGTDETFRNIFPDMFSEESWQYWLNVRKHIGEKYGKTDLEATLNIAKEINVGEDILKCIQEKQFYNNKNIYLSKNFEVKICAYADQRVSPNGVLSLEGRLDEAKTRHRGIPESSVNRPNYEELKHYASKIEGQIFAFVDGNPEDINDKSIGKYITILKSYKFEG